MLIPHLYKGSVEIRSDLGLIEAKEVTRVAYYDSNNNPNIGCKTCRKEKSLLTGEEKLNFSVNPKRNGSAYCEEHALTHRSS